MLIIVRCAAERLCFELLYLESHCSNIAIDKGGCIFRLSVKSKLVSCSYTYIIHQSWLQDQQIIDFVCRTGFFFSVPLYLLYKRRK